MIALAIGWAVTAAGGFVALAVYVPRALAPAAALLAALAPLFAAAALICA